MQSLPFLLILSRLLFAIIIPIVGYVQVEHFEILIVVLMVLGLVSDVFDGIIARKLNISTEKLRIWDSNVDQVFWLSIFVTVCALRLDIIKDFKWQILVLVKLEGVAYLISFLKFKKTIATHSILAKLWTITLLVFFCELLLFESSMSFIACFVLGIISRLEIIAIVLFLRTWATDVPSILSVGKINRGEPIKKHKLFNG